MSAEDWIARLERAFEERKRLAPITVEEHNAFRIMLRRAGRIDLVGGVRMVYPLDKTGWRPSVAMWKAFLVDRWLDRLGVADFDERRRLCAERALDEWSLNRYEGRAYPPRPRPVGLHGDRSWRSRQSEDDNCMRWRHLFLVASVLTAGCHRAVGVTVAQLSGGRLSIEASES